MFMDDAEAIEAGTPCGQSALLPISHALIHGIDTVNEQLLHWYDAALFFLYKGDFLRKHDICSVQSIVVLGIVFNNTGDSSLHLSLWGAAIRIG